MAWEPTAYVFSSSEAQTGTSFGSAHSSSYRSPFVSSASDPALEVTTNHKNLPFACTFPGCTRRFKRKFTLKDHVNAHLGAKPFVCPVSTCLRRFTTSGNLARHRRLHPWLDTPLPCRVDGCECEFPNDEKLQRHIQSHLADSGEYRCEIGTCGRVFSTIGNLRRHTKRNHTDAPENNWLNVGSRPRRLAMAMRASSKYTPECRDAPPAHRPFPARNDDPFEFDDELLDALSYLFDEDGVECLV